MSGNPAKTASKPLSPLLQRHRVAAHHALWLAVSVAFVVEAGLLVDRLDDEYTSIAAFGGTAAVWGAVSCLLALLTAPPRVGARPRKRPPAPRGPVPWRWPWVAAYAVGVPVLVLVAGSLATDDGDAAVTQTFVWALCALLGWLVGVGVALLGAVVWLTWVGAVAFGRPALTGRVDGEPVPRAPYVGPFVALLGLLSLPLVLVGAASYDSPYRRDLLPLLGIERDGVEVTHPALLLASQAATWWLLAGVAVGFVISRWAAARSHSSPPADG